MEQQNELKELRKQNYQIMAQVVKDMTKGNDKLRHNILKEFNQGVSSNSKQDDAKTLQLKIDMHKQLLKQQKERGTDPISLLEKEIKIQQANQQNRFNHPDLLYEHQIFLPQKSNSDKCYAQPHQQTASSFFQQKSTKKLAQDIVSLSEDQILEQMVQDGEKFDMKKINDFLLTGDMVYNGALDKIPNNMFEHKWARSPDQIINSAQTQTNSPIEEQLAQLYDPFNPVREVYLRTKYQMHVNHNLRQQLAIKILQAKTHFSDLAQIREFFQVSVDEMIKNHNSFVIPTKVLDMIETDYTENKPVAVTSSQMIQSIKQFDPKSQDILNYNKELALHASRLRQTQAQISETRAKHSLDQLQKQKTEILMQHDFIIKLIQQNGVRSDLSTHGFVFESNVAKDNLQLANQNLKMMLDFSQCQDPTYIIPNSVFNSFFCNSISQDNFDGLAYLINYVEQLQIDTSKWQIDRFRSGLDFYLNHSFNISKVLTFTRFYVNHVQSTLNKALPIEKTQILNTMSEEELALLHIQVFGKVQDLVDIHALFGHLVERIGTKQLIDPISKQDPMMALIDLYADPRIQYFSKLSEQGTTSISEDDMVKYLMNQLNQPNSFKIFERIVFQHLNNDYFICRLITKLRQTRVKQQGILPQSLGSSNVKQLYLKVKALATANDDQSEHQAITISEKAAELLLFLFRANNMVPEAVDLCQNFEQLVKKDGANQSDIRNYHMSDALLQVELADNIQSDHHYYSLIDKAVFTDESQKQSAAYLISMTKAYLKDGNVDHAIKFFNEGLEKRRQIKEKQDDIFIKMFNSTFDLDHQSDCSSITLQDFTSKLYNLVAARQRMKREASLIKMLEDILNRCEPTEIDNVFNYQAVLREERLILLSLSAVDPIDYGSFYEAYNRIGVDSFELQKFVSDHLSDQKQSFNKWIKYLREFQIEVLDEQLDDISEKIKVDIDNNLQQSGHGENRSVIFEDLKVQEDEFDQMSDQQKVQLRQNLVSQIAKRLILVRQRREALENKLSYEKIHHIQDLMNSAQDETVQLMDNVEDLQQTMIDLGFPQENYSNFKQYQKDQQNIEQVIEIMKSESDQGRLEKQEKVFSDFMKKFKQTVKESTDEAVDQINYDQKAAPISLFQKFENLSDVDEYEDEQDKLRQIVDGMHEQYEDNQWPQQQPDQEMLQLYDEFLYEDPIDGALGDEDSVIKQQIYDKAVQNHYEELKHIVNSRRQRSLPEAINIFNKIQNKQLPLWMRPEGELNTKRVSSKDEQINIQQIGEQITTDDTTKKTQYDFAKEIKQTFHKSVQDADAFNDNLDDINQNYEVVDYRKINQTIQRYRYLLQDATSPFISNFNQLLDYDDGRDLMDIRQFHDLYKSITPMNQDYVKQKHPLRVYMNQSDKLITLINELDKIIDGSIQMQSVILQKELDLKATLEGDQKYKDWYSNKKTQSLKNLIDQNIKQLYNQFIKDQQQNVSVELQDLQSQQQATTSNSVFLPKTMSKQSIIDMTSQLQIAGFKQYEVLNMFYAEDLIAFGIDNDIPVAVRLGEKVFSESNKQIPTPLATAIKNYKMSHQASYNSAMKQTGPIDTAKAYKSHSLNPSGAFQKHSTSSIISRDDPYWREYQERNFAAVDHFRLPSALAWDHKQDGLFGELFDMKKLRKDAQIINSKL